MEEDRGDSLHLIDESGDLGFDFAKRGTSRHFVITILLVHTNDNAHRIRRAIRRTLRRKVPRRPHRPPTISELKGSHTPFAVKEYYWRRVASIDFALYAIVLNKRRVYDDLRRVPHRLYNYMARQLVDPLPLDGVRALDVSIDRSKSRREIESFNRYLSIHLEGALHPRAVLHIDHVASQADKAIQAVDLFCWGIYRKYERQDEDWYELFGGKIAYETVFLP